MLFIEELVVLFVLVAGLPLIVVETKKFPRMKYILLGYICVIIAGITAILTVPASTSIMAMSKSVCIMTAGLFFGAGAFVSFNRMKKVVE